MVDAPIPHFPVVHGNVYPDGTAHINFAGHDVPLTPTNIDDARAQITSYAIAVARDVLHRPVRLTTVDPDGQCTLAAHPDSRIMDLANLSRTHFAIAWSAEVPTIIDQHSGNGTRIQRRGIDLSAAPDVATPLHDGDRLHLGDLSCQVTLFVTSEVTPR